MDPLTVTSVGGGPGKVLGDGLSGPSHLPSLSAVILRPKMFELPLVIMVCLVGRGIHTLKCFLKDKLMCQIASPSSTSSTTVSTSPQAIPNAPQSASIASASDLSSITQSQSHSSWNADTGASAHMTFNRHWMRHMTPHRIPIHIADGSVLYSEGSLRDDKGGEYMFNEVEAFCIDHGIQRQHTVRNRPQQNGVAERANRTMEECVISMLYESEMPPSFWGEALSSFIYLCEQQVHHCFAQGSHSSGGIHWDKARSLSSLHLGLHCLCADQERQATTWELWNTHGKVHLHLISSGIQGLEVLQP
jgi:hypothetical protein